MALKVPISEVELLGACLEALCLLDSSEWEVSPSTMMEVIVGW